jgi:hypothetical protein
LTFMLCRLDQEIHNCLGVSSGVANHLILKRPSLSASLRLGLR